MEKSVGVKTIGADTYIAAFSAAEQAESKSRVVQIIGLTAGKILETPGLATRSVTSDDSADVSAIVGDIEIGDNSYLACYVVHAGLNGSCLLTPLLCDNDGSVIASLDSKVSRVMLPIYNGSGYLSNCLSWPVLETGAWKVFVHVTDLSTSNTIDIWCYTF
jgi:hypothetical protein